MDAHTNGRATKTRKGTPAPPGYPFTAVVGQAELQLALLLNVIEPAIGGALIMGQRGTGKSTAVRALADLLPPLVCVRGCAYNCDPVAEFQLCADCRARLTTGPLPHLRARVPVVELPLNATEDRLCGSINFERALAEGVRAFEPGLLARANRGLLYIDEVNLLEDHLIDLLLDAAASGRNRVAREGVSAEHPARFVLIGSGNPEEGELRPQLLDRFGLCAEVHTPTDIDERVEVVMRREAFDRDPADFCAHAAGAQARLRRRIVRARKLVGAVAVPRPLLRRVAELCQRLEVAGHRGELTITRAARALAAFEGRSTATDEDVRRVAALALRHRLRRDPFDQSEGGARVEQALAESFPPQDSTAAEPSAAHTDAAAHAAAPNNPLNTQPNKPAGNSRNNLRNDTPADNDAPSSGGSGATRPARGAPTPDPDGRAADARATDRAAPPVATQAPGNLLTVAARGPAQRRALGNASRSRQGARVAGNVRHGRYARAVAGAVAGLPLALDATLRAAAPWQLHRRAARASLDGGPARVPVSEVDARSIAAKHVNVTAADVHVKRYSRRRGTLFIFAVDTSGSMALNRIGQAKGALAQLLRQAYVNRDRVALISFRARAAELWLRPSHAPVRARRLLDALPVGGGTPLAAGLARALDVARMALRQHTERVVLLVFTDGRANVPLAAATAGMTGATLHTHITHELAQLGAALLDAGVSAVVVDTQQRYTGGGEGAALARVLGGRYVPLPATSLALR